MLQLLFRRIAFVVVLLWPVIPIFWIPVHCSPRFFRRLGLFTYIFPAVTWTPLALFLFSKEGIIMNYAFEAPPLLMAAGGFFLFAGTALQVWTGRLLTLKGLMGMPEVSGRVESRFVRSGPYKVVRHPTYLSHTLMFLGLALLSGLAAMGLVTMLDFALVRFIVIPLEDRELSARFGPGFDVYRKEVPAFFPRLRSRKDQGIRG